MTSRTLLAIVAGIFFLVGVLSLVEIFVQGIVHQQLHINLGVLAIFLAVALMRYSPTGRYWARLLLWFNVVLGLILLVIVAIAKAFPGTIGGTVTGSWPALAALAVALAGLGWMAWVLDRPDIRELFENSYMPRPPAARFQFRLRHAFLLILAAALGFARLVQDDVVFIYRQYDYGTTVNSIQTADGKKLITYHRFYYGCREYRYADREPILDYVVFVNQTLPTPGEVTGEYSRGDLTLRLPDDSSINLPADWQLAEIHNGELRTSTKRISYRDLEEYIEKNRERNLTELIEFCGRRQDAAASPPAK